LQAGSNECSSIHNNKFSLGGLVLKNFLLLTLTVALTVGVVWPEAGAAASQYNLQSYGVIAIFIISGLQLKQGEAMKALQATGEHRSAPHCNSHCLLTNQNNPVGTFFRTIQ
jgi:hypothetical protein